MMSNRPGPRARIRPGVGADRSPQSIRALKSRTLAWFSPTWAALPWNVRLVRAVNLSPVAVKRGGGVGVGVGAPPGPATVTCIVTVLSFGLCDPGSAIMTVTVYRPGLA